MNQRFLILMLCPMSFTPSSLGSGGDREDVMLYVLYPFVFRERRGWRGYFCHISWTYTPERLESFVWNLNHANKTLSETLKFEIWNLYSINYVIKTKYILLELKASWPMSAFSEIYNCGHNILELVDVLPNVSFTTKRTGTWLLLTKMVNTSWLTSFQTTKI